MSLLNYTEEQIEELRRCKDDPVYFIKNYFHILHPTKGSMLFDMYPVQEELIRSYHSEQHSVSLSSRQTGASLCLSAYALWTAMFKPEWTIALVSNKQDNARALLSCIRFALDRLPLWLRPNIITDNKRAMRFAHRSSIITAASNGNAFRGHTINLFIWDSAMYTREPDASEMWNTVRPIICSANSKSIVSTTGTKLLTKDEHHIFWQLWRNAIRGISDQKANLTKWDSVPGRGEEFKRRLIDIIGEKQWRREYECEFVFESGA